MSSEAEENDTALYRIAGEIGFDVPSGEGSLSEMDWATCHANRKMLHRAREAIYGRAESEHERGERSYNAVTVDESKALEAVGVRLKAVNKQMDNLARNNGETHKAGAASMGSLPSGGAIQSGSDWVDANGKPIRVAAKNTSFAEVVGGGGAECSIGDMIRGAVTGDIAHLPRQAQQSIGTPSAGGYTVPTPLSASVIDLARARSRVMQAGASVVPMTSKTLKMARLESDPTAYWRAENQGITESDGTFGQVEFDAKVAAILVRASIELIEDSVNFNQVMQNAISEALSAEMDRVALFGSGQGEEPTGIYNTSGVQYIDLTNSDSPPSIVPFASPKVYSPFSRAVQACQEKNVVAGDFILSPRTWGIVDRATATDNQPLQPPRSVSERAMLTTTRVPDDMEIFDRDDASAIFTGAWPTLMYGIRTNLTFEVTRVGDDAFKKMQFLMRMYVRMDVQLQRPEQFVVVRGVAPSVE